MAKSVSEALSRRRENQGAASSETRTSPVGRSVLGYKKTYTQDEWNRIEAERQAMRERLTAEG